MKFLALCCLGISAVAAVDITRDRDLVVQIGQAPTKLDVMHLLDKPRQWVYDFKADCDEYTFEPGSVCNANRATFPATTGNGMTMAMLNLGPCSMLPPHFHARASNYVVAISGTTITYMIEENGASVITSELTHGKMTIFPQGSIHSMMNTGCENAQLISALSNEDAGTTNLANNLFLLPQDIVTRVLSGIADFNETQHLIPPFGTGSNSGSEECLARCSALSQTAKKPADSSSKEESLTTIEPITVMSEAEKTFLYRVWKLFF